MVVNNTLHSKPSTLYKETITDVLVTIEWYIRCRYTANHKHPLIFLGNNTRVDPNCLSHDSPEGAT